MLMVPDDRVTDSAPRINFHPLHPLLKSISASSINDPTKRHARKSPNSDIQAASTQGDTINNEILQLDESQRVTCDKKSQATEETGKTSATTGIGVQAELAHKHKLTRHIVTK